MAPHRLDRNQTLRNRPALFGDLSLESSRLTTTRGERGISLADHAARYRELARVVARDRGDEPEPRGRFWHSKERYDPPALARPGFQLRRQLVGSQLGQFRPANATAVRDSQE
jgi:hypothetical protein